MRAQKLVLIGLASLAAGSATLAQTNRGWSDWLTAYGDAQRTSWIRTDPKISVDAMAQPGFELQWKTKLDNQNRGASGLMQGVTANGVTLFVPVSLIAGSSNNIHMVDNDTGYVVWSRRFEGALPAASAGCAGGITSAATRIVAAAAAPTPAAGAAPAPAGGRGAQQGYRSLLGEPGQGVPVEGRGGAGRAAGPAPAGPGPIGEAGFARQGGAGAAGAPGAGPGRQGGGGQGAPGRQGGGGQAGAGRGAQLPAIPGAPANVNSAGGLGRPSGVVYVVSSDGQLHVLGLQSGKDLQRPAPFLPANAQSSNAVAVGTMMYAATSGNCGGAPNGVFGVDLDNANKPVVTYRTNGGGVVGAVALSSDGNTLLAAIGAGAVTGEGKANAIVALDPRTLQLKDWFSQPTAEFVTGPMVFRHGTRDVVAAATKDGRIILLDVASLGGANHATPLATSRALFGGGGSFSADALSTWARATAASGATPASETRWILAPISGRPSGARATNGAIRNGAVVALRVVDAKGVLSLEHVWASHDLASAATPITVNGVVFALSSGRASAGATGSPAVLYAYDGATGKALWNSAKAMTTSAAPGSFWSALSQVYIGATDGTVHAFGFLDERR